MGTGDYICVTLRGGAPWGFTLREGEGDTYRPFQVFQVKEDGQAYLAGVREGDEVVSLNGEPCIDLTLSQAFGLIDASPYCLQLLVKRYGSASPGDLEPEGTYCGERASSREALESTTLHILSPSHTSQRPGELYKYESQDEAYYGEVESDTEVPKGTQLSYQLQLPSSGGPRGLEPLSQEKDVGVRRSFSPGAMVELQVSLSEQTLGCTSLGSALGIEGLPSNREATNTIQTTTQSIYVPCPVREPLGQHGVVLSSPSMLGQVEVTLQQPAASGTGAGRGILTVGEGVGGLRTSGSVGSQGEGERGGHRVGAPESFTVTFGIPSAATPTGEQDSDSEGDPDKPSKHRARHARLRRSESQSEKQVKEAKSKCKRIALLLTAAPSNPNNKGVLMFKKHRQRAKKYTLVSYGTGGSEPESEDSDEEDEEETREDTHSIEFTLVATSDSELDEHFFNAQGDKSVLTFNWDKGLLEIERNLNNPIEMECLPDTKGKGALMFAQRRQRMDEISAEHDELRRQGIPVEGVQVTEKKMEECSYMQAMTEGHAYMDVNMHQQSQQQHQQYQQYQEQQHYEQHQHYQQQQQHQYQQQYQQQQQQYEQQHYQQQQTYHHQQQQQEYHEQQQQQTQQYSANMNGIVHQQTNEMQSSFSNRTAKPFSAQNVAPAPYSPAISGTNQDAMGQGEQIASRDERISTPAIRTGVLQDTRRKYSGKPMFTFKEAPKMSPNPALLNLLNRNNKKLGFESGPEEDYLSLGAEACNFLQSPVKHKTPPPVAPKPVINPNSPPWSPQIEVTNQDMPQYAENSVSAPAVAPTAETTPAPELEPTPAPAPEPSPPPAPQEAPANMPVEEQQTWTPPEPQPQQQPQQVIAWEENSHMNSPPQPEPVAVSSWASAQTQAQQQSCTSSWPPPQVQPQEPAPSQSPQQPPWVTPQPTQPQAQPQPPMDVWAPPPPQPQVQPIWAQPQDLMSSHSLSKFNQPGLNLKNPCNSSPSPHGHNTHKQTLSLHHRHGLSSPSKNLKHNHLGFSRLSQNPSHNCHGFINLSNRLHNKHGPRPKHTAQPQQLWAQQPPEHAQPPMNSWGPEQNQAQAQPPWAQPVPTQSPPQTSWQQTPPQRQTPPQAPMNAWSPAQTQPQTPANAWAPQPQQPPVNTSAPMVNPRVNLPSPKPWNPSQNAPRSQTPPPPPQRMNSYTFSQRSSPLINPMATVLNPSSSGSSVDMPAVRGKGADLFAKRQSRMEKFVVDSETVQANKASRPISPTVSLPNEWKYTSSVRAPPPLAYNPIQSPSYPPAAIKQPPPSSPAAKAKKKGKDKPAIKPLNVVDVMKHQPYQLNSSLFTYGPAVEAAKPPVPKPDPAPPTAPVQNQPIRYEQMAPVQPAGLIHPPYPQQSYGVPPQPLMHDGHYQQAPANAYPPANPYQQAPGGPYQQAYNPQYQQAPPPAAYHPQAPQSPNSPYQQAPQAPYQPASSPPYMAAPTAPYQPQPPSSYVAPSFPIAARPESAAGGSPAAAPKPRFTAKKSSAQGLGRSYSLPRLPSARLPCRGQQTASACSSPKPPARASSVHLQNQASWLGSYKAPSPWEAASRHPLGMVDEAFAFQNLQQAIAANVHLAAQRKMLPEPPAEWKARVSYQAPRKTGCQIWSQSQSHSQSRASLPALLSPTKSNVSAPAGPAGYRSLPRQWQPQKSMTEANLRASVSSEYNRPVGRPSYKPMYTNNTTWSWKR
ncbi:synaptopodin-2 [Diretmus argenteus]